MAVDYDEVVLRIREKHGLTQQELADRIGVYRRTISNWECMRTVPQERLWQRLVNEFGVCRTVE